MTKKEKADACTPATKETERGQSMDTHTISACRSLRNTLLSDEVIELRNDRDRLLSKLDRIVVLSEEGYKIADECGRSCLRLQALLLEIKIAAKHCR